MRISKAHFLHRSSQLLDKVALIAVCGFSIGICPARANDEAMKVKWANSDNWEASAAPSVGARAKGRHPLKMKSAGLKSASFSAPVPRTPWKSVKKEKVATPAQLQRKLSSSGQPKFMGPLANPTSSATNASSSELVPPGILGSSSTTSIYGEKDMSLATVFIMMQYSNQSMISERDRSSASATAQVSDMSGGQVAGGTPPAGSTLSFVSVIKADSKSRWTPSLLTFLERPEIPQATRKFFPGLSKNFEMPKYVFGLGYEYQLSELRSASVRGMLFDTIGAGDLNLGVTQLFPKSLSGDALLISRATGQLSLPTSRRSKDSNKITSLQAGGSMSYVKAKLSLNFNGSYTHSLYKGEEKLEERMTEMSSNSIAPEMQGNYSPDQGRTGVSPTAPYAINDSAEDLGMAAIPSFDIYYFSRETGRTQMNLGYRYQLFPRLSFSSQAGGTYSYLESTYSRWQSQVTYVQANYTFQNYAASANLSAVSKPDQQDQLYWPSELTVGVKLSLMGWL